jgi:hypothetical protein
METFKQLFGRLSGEARLRKYFDLNGQGLGFSRPSAAEIGSLQGIRTAAP